MNTWLRTSDCTCDLKPFKPPDLLNSKKNVFHLQTTSTKTRDNEQREKLKFANLIKETVKTARIWSWSPPLWRVSSSFVKKMDQKSPCEHFSCRVWHFLQLAHEMKSEQNEVVSQFYPKKRQNSVPSHLLPGFVASIHLPRCFIFSLERRLQLRLAWVRWLVPLYFCHSAQSGAHLMVVVEVHILHGAARLLEASVRVRGGAGPVGGQDGVDGDGVRLHRVEERLGEQQGGRHRQRRLAAL